MALQFLGDRSLGRRKLVIVGKKRILHPPPHLEAKQQNWENISKVFHSPGEFSEELVSQ